MDRNHHGNGWAVKGNGESGKKREAFKQEVYDLMCGQMEPEESVVPGAGNIRNEFVEGSFCGKEYEKIYEANRNLCERLGVEEDGDVEMILDSFYGIMKLNIPRWGSHRYLFEIHLYMQGSRLPFAMHNVTQSGASMSMTRAYACAKAHH